MSFDMENPHTLYVLACYALGGAAYLGLLVHSVLNYHHTKKQLQEKKAS